MLLTQGYPEGLPCSPLVANLVALIDGHRPVAEILTTLCQRGNADQQAQLIASAFKALEILYVDGTIAELSGV